MSRCPCCGYEPEDEGPPLFPNVGPGPFIPRVEVVGGANLDALLDSCLTVDFDASGAPVRADWITPSTEPAAIRIEIDSSEEEL